MKIVIDGFNLGLKEGTGIATYGRELSKLLFNNGHEVSAIYGLEGVSEEKSIAWSQFIQSLTIYGESGKRDFSQWKKSLMHLMAHFSRIPVSLHDIPIREEVDYASVAGRLPAFSQIYNLPSIYRRAHAYANLSNKNMLIRLPKSLKADILHLTCPIPISMSHAAKVVTFHDVIPLILPHTTKVNLKQYQRKLQTSLSDAKAILSVSQYSKQSLIKYLDIPEEKVFVTYQAVDIPEYYLNLSDEEVSRFIDINFSLKFKNYFLFYGTIEPKKNILRILEAFTLAKTDASIVIVGKNGWLFDDVNQFYEQLSLRDGNKFKRISYCSFRNLMYLLKGARGLVFPSLCEGFGLPILEAMQMKCPVITSNISSLPEVAGDAAYYVDHTDPRSIADAVDKFSADELFRNSLIEKGSVQAQKFSPRQHYSRLNEAYQSVL